MNLWGRLMFLLTRYSRFRQVCEILVCFFVFISVRSVSSSFFRNFRFTLNCILQVMKVTPRHYLVEVNRIYLTSITEACRCIFI